MLAAAPAGVPTGVPITQDGVTYLVVVLSGQELANFMPLPPAAAESEIVQVLISDPLPATAYRVAIVAMGGAGVVVLRQQVAASWATATMVQFLAPAGAAVLQVSVEAER